MRITLAALAVLTLLFTSPAYAITRGEVKDRLAATEVERCARQYIGKPKNGTDPELWQMCLEIVSEQEGRKIENVKARVIVNNGNVF